MPPNDSLTSDELTVLLIAAEGESMMPIGRWEAPVRSLGAKGYMVESAQFNWFITDAGRAAARQNDDANFKAVIDTRNAIVGAHEKAKARAEELAVLLAELARFSAQATGDPPMTALREWGKIVLERAKEMIG
jgi:hypothetical protein